VSKKKQVLLEDLTRNVARIGRECGIASVFVYNNACFDETCRKTLLACMGNIKAAVLEMQHLMNVHQSTPAQSGRRRTADQDHRPLAQQKPLLGRQDQIKRVR
jgi:hypothetical protein